MDYFNLVHSNSQDTKSNHDLNWPFTKKTDFKRILIITSIQIILPVACKTCLTLFAYLKNALKSAIFQPVGGQSDIGVV